MRYRMPGLYRKNRKKTGFICMLLSMALLMAALPGRMPVRAAETDPSADYIVKYTEEAASLMKEEADQPFDVVDGKELNRLLREDALEWYEKDGDAVLMDVPSGSYDPEEQWNLSIVNADGAFQARHLGEGIRVGLVDSGVSPHPAFGDRLLAGGNYIQDAEDPLDTADYYGHGTRVAGLIAAADESGYIGIAPGADIVPLKCTDERGVKVSAICRAVYSGIDDYGCNVLNLSLGVRNEYQSLKEAVEYAESKHVVVVSAAGNNGTAAVYYPAAYDSVIGVGSVDRNGLCYSRSNHNSSVFLTAPGVLVRSTDAGGGYTESTGCSFAVPQVSGAAAVLLGIDGGLEPERVRQILAETAQDRGTEGYDEYYGYGILDLGACVSCLPQREKEEAPSYGAGCARDESCILKRFADLDCEAWYHGALHYALEKEIMNGCAEDLFLPDENSSRAMIVTMIWRMEGRPSSGVSPAFHDVSEEQWYAEAVRWAAGEGIVSGYSRTDFGPEDPVTREQLAAVLCRYAGWKGTGTEFPSGGDGLLERFADAGQISDWALDEVGRAVSLNLLQGVDEDRFCPGMEASRAQAAAVLMRLEGLLSGHRPIQD